MTRAYTKPRYEEAAERINTREVYDLSKLARSGAFWWASDRRTYRKIIEADLKGRNLLGTRKVGSGKGTKYLINGRTIKQFIMRHGPALELTTAINTYDQSKTSGSSRSKQQASR